MQMSRSWSFGVALLCFGVALLLPWWGALALVIIPLFFTRTYVLGILFGIVLDSIYGYRLATFPFHTVRFTITIIIAAILIFLLKKVLRL